MIESGAHSREPSASTHWPISLPLQLRVSMRRFAVGAGVCSMLFAGSVLAHHGWNEYDANKPLTLSGAVIDSGYDNPHGFVRMKAGDRTWRVILAPPSRMEARGLPRGTLKPGVAISVVGYPHRTDAQELRAERITVESGSAVELR